jgi:uncharacterized protein (DUF2461 family)
MPTYFTAQTFKFQRSLARNNNREWFQAHKDEYEKVLRGPFLQLIADLQPELREVSEHFRADPKPVEAPSYYLHIQPGNCFVGAGLWHPQPGTQRKIRQFIFDNPGNWKAAVHKPAFRKKFDMDGESLVRAPSGFPADHELIDDLKRKNFVAMTKLDDETVLGLRLRKTVGDQFKLLAPMVDYLCAALDLEF